MNMQFRSNAAWLATLALTLLAANADAQVPQDMTYTGRLVDNLGAPLAGPVDLELRVFDAATGPTQLYSEEHIGVALDATGGFSVQLGLGTSPSGTFDAALFSDANRWLEVVVGIEVLTPRQIIGSVPWALIAQQANEIVPDPNAPRFEDCGDGTVADHQTGLEWEKKTGTLGTPVNCGDSSLPSCPDPHDVNNIYPWQRYSVPATPSAYTVYDIFEAFLPELNDPLFGTAATQNDVTGCFAGHCDWRVPTIVELQTIADCSSGAPCIDPIFGPTVSNYYWSSSQDAGLSTHAWWARFSNGSVGVFNQTNDFSVRAVRVGSCH